MQEWEEKHFTKSIQKWEERHFTIYAKVGEEDKRHIHEICRLNQSQHHHKV
jgi:hypothetical protein